MINLLKLILTNKINLKIKRLMKNTNKTISQIKNIFQEDKFKKN